MLSIALPKGGLEAQTMLLFAQADPRSESSRAYTRSSTIRASAR